MSREEIQKLLGGYATGTLTAEEQQALFAAALQDQELFDALAREQSLRDLLRDPAARAHLLAALDRPIPAPWFRRWWMPVSAAAMAVVLASVVIVAVRRHPPAAPQVAVAKLEPPVASPTGALPPPAPALRPAAPRPVRSNTAMAGQRKSPPAAMQPMAPAPAPPPVASPAEPKNAVPKDKVEFAASAGATTMAQVQASARAVEPQAVSPSKAEELRNLPVTTRTAAATGVNADLKTSAAPAEALALFGGSAFVAARGGRAGGGGAGGGVMGGLISGSPVAARPMAKAFVAAAGHLGIQYRVLRNTPAGEFVEADSAATGSVAAGTLFKLQIAANESGYVRILQEAPDGAWREIANHAVERMQPIETEPIERDQPGRVKFYLSFSRQPLPPSNVAHPDDDIVVDRGRVVTVAGRDAAARQLSFNITLTIQ